MSYLDILNEELDETKVNESYDDDDEILYKDMPTGIQKFINKYKLEIAQTNKTIHGKIVMLSGRNEMPFENVRFSKNQIKELSSIKEVRWIEGDNYISIGF
tara:strand:- start:663 stop:965 length:303 start_codon:yes stop_codon:yes gene_type:complete